MELESPKKSKSKPSSSKKRRDNEKKKSSKKDRKRSRQSSSSSRKKTKTSSPSSPSPKKRSRKEPSTKEVLQKTATIEPLNLRSSTTTSNSNASTTTTTTNVVQIKTRIDSSTSTSPPTVSFPSGMPPSILQQQQQQQQQRTLPINYDALPEFTWTDARRSSATKDGKGKILEGTDDQCSYSSSNDGRGYDGRKTKFCIVLYDKLNKSFKVAMAAERGTVFSLEQRVTDSVVAGGMTAAAMDLQNLSAMERRRLLFESFGSSKKRRALRSQAANVVEMGSVVGSGVGMMDALGRQGEGVVSESNVRAMDEVRKSGADAMAKAADKAQDEARRTYLPPYDKNAEAPHKVYDSQELAGEEVWSQISRQVDACIKKDDQDWVENLTSRGRWFQSTKTLLSAVKSPAKRGAKYQIKTIVLLNHLLVFHTKCSKTFLDGTEDDMVQYVRLPKEACNKLLSLFSTPSHDRGKAGYAITKQMKDKRVLHILVMYLLANGRDMKVGSIEEICQDLKIEVKEASKLYRMAGCSIRKGGKAEATSVSLSVPLEFPKVGRGRA